MKKRRIDLDIMRIIACFLVIFNHLEGYTLYANSNMVSRVWLYMFPTMITRINVPLFLMISGALLLGDREERYKDIIRKRLLRIVYVLLICAAILYCLNGGRFSLIEFIRYIITGLEDIGGGAYWYLYSYMGFLLLLPILRKVAKSMTMGDFIFLLIIHFIFSSFLPMVNFACQVFDIPKLIIQPDLKGAFDLGLERVMFYPLLGYWLDHNIDLEKTSHKNVFFLLSLGIGGIVASNICTFYEGWYGETFTQNYVMLFDYLTAIVAFVLIKYFCIKHNNFIKYPKFVFGISMLGTLTFGIYLLDPILKIIFYALFKNVLFSNMPTFLVSIFWCLTSMVCGGIITYGIRKIPGMNKLF